MEQVRELFSHMKEEGLFHQAGRLAVTFSFGETAKGYVGLAFTTKKGYPPDKLERLQKVFQQHEVLEGTQDIISMANYREGTPMFYHNEEGGVTFIKSFRKSLLGSGKVRTLGNHLRSFHEDPLKNWVYADLFIDSFAQGAKRESRPMTRFKAALREIHKEHLPFHSGEPAFEYFLGGDKDHSVFSFNTPKEYPSGKLLQLKTILNKHDFVEVPSGALEKSAPFHAGEPVYALANGVIRIAKRIPFMALEATPDSQYLRGLLQEHNAAEGEVRVRLADRVVEHLFKGHDPKPI